MADSSVIASIDTIVDSYDNVLSETVNGFYKSELIQYLKQNWNGIDDVKLVMLAQAALRTQPSSCKAKSVFNISHIQ
ncbi:hypothetical protein [Psychrobacter sp. SWN149]|uniref:hypothetical protein n=1 Tax=Psychrobacter sp. SWN149 TaxID=2792057 RepID=UPI0018CF04AC|nr:hypothetical protein [Psychrobacter sp. SWN149]MBH0006823.1 hypothetical protein [Psychrobacter sp. SWN149]